MDTPYVCEKSSSRTLLAEKNRPACAKLCFIGNERVPKITIIDTIKLFFKLHSAFWLFQTITVFECCLIKLLPYILFEKYIYILALEMASPGNRHCASCIGTLSFPIASSFTCVDTIRYDTRCYFNVRSKADISQLNLPHGTDN